MQEKLTPTLFKEWEALWRTSEVKHLYNSPYWARVINTTTGENKPAYVTVYYQKKLKAILPLMRARVAGITTFTTPGSKIVDKSPLLVSRTEQELLVTLFSYLKDFSSFYLPEVPETIILDTISLTIADASLNPILSVSDNPFAFVSKKQKSKLCNKLAKNQNNISFTSEKNSLPALRKAILFEGTSTKAGKGMYTLQDIQTQQLLKSITKERYIDLVIDVLTFQKSTIAVSIGFQCENTFYAFYTAFSGAYRGLSPGKLLVVKIMERLYREKMTLLDFGRGYNTLKKEFTPYYQMQYNLTYTRNNLNSIWWKYANIMKEELVRSKRLYSLYLQGKKLLH